MWKDIPSFPEWVEASKPFRARHSSKIWLKEIDTWIRRYNVAGRPIDSLRHLRSALDEWSNEAFSHTYDCVAHAVRQDLDGVVQRKWRELTKLARGYQQVVCIAYEAKLSGAYTPGDPSKNAEAADLEKRWDKMKDAIERAYRRYKTKHWSSPPEEEEKKLKLFMAPEFYFRGPSGA